MKKIYLYVGPTDHHHLFRKRQNAFVKAYLVWQLKHMFSVFKQYYTYFHTLFYSHVFPHMFSNNKIHVFKYIYQTPRKLLYFMEVNSLVSEGQNSKMFLIPIDSASASKYQDTLSPWFLVSFLANLLPFLICLWKFIR